MFARRGAALLLSSTLLLGACGSDPVTKAQFLAHAEEFSTAAKTPEQKAQNRKVFSCLWPKVSKDPELLDDFMGAAKATDDLSRRLSKLMIPCVTGGA